MRAVRQRATAKGVTAAAFGDLFLQDVRDYRVRQLQGSGLEPLFPIWQTIVAGYDRRGSARVAVSIIQRLR
jgi:hypothetical protein